MKLPALVALFLAQAHPDPSLDPLLRRGRAALEANRPDEALAAAETALRRAPEDPGFLVLAGEALRRLGRARDALGPLQRADSLSPGQPKVKLELGLAAADLGDYGIAVESFRAALAKLPDHAGLLYNLGVVLQRRGDPVEAIEAFRKAWTLRPDLEGLAGVFAEGLLSRDEFEEAESVVRAAMARSPSGRGLQALLGRALAGRGDLEGALRAFDDAVAEGEAAGAVRLGRARVRMRLGDFAGAEEDARASLEADPYDSAALFLLATALQRRGRDAEAREAFDRYRRDAPLLLDLVSNRDRIRSDPTDIQGYLNLAYLYMRLDDPERVKESMEKALSLDPRLMEQATTRGLVAFSAERFEDALAQFESVREQRPEFPDVHLYLQRCHERLGHPEEAKRFRARFEELTAEKRR